MLLADFHIHTYIQKEKFLHYDALYSPKDVVRKAKQVGLNYIAMELNNSINLCGRFWS